MGIKEENFQQVEDFTEADDTQASSGKSQFCLVAKMIKYIIIVIIQMSWSKFRVLLLKNSR